MDDSSTSLLPELPRTGDQSGPAVLVGLSTVLVGSALVALAVRLWGRHR